MGNKEQPKNWGVYLLPLLLCGFLLVRYTLWRGPAIGTALFAFLLVPTCLLYCRSTGAKPMRESYGMLLLIAPLALSFGLYENAQIRLPLLAMLLCLLPYWMLTAKGARIEPSVGRYVPRDVWRAALTLPWQGAQSAGKRLRKDEKSGATARYILYGLLFSVPLLLAVGFLLLSADSEFRHITETWIETLKQETLLQLFLSLPLGVYLLFMLRGIAGAGPQPLPEAAGKRLIPAASAATVLALLGAVYLFFCVVQAMNIAGIVSGEIQQSARFYSQYAREGFFELCAVVIINLAVFVGIQVFSHGNQRIVAALQSLLGALTLLLILTACFKMGLYIRAYGFTLLRLHTMWFMAVLFIVFCLLIARQWIAFPVIRWSLAVCFALFIAMGHADTGGIVIRANIGMYKSGALATLDLSQYDHFPYAATPHLLALYEEADDPSLHTKIESFVRRWAPKKTESLLNQSMQRVRSEALLRNFIVIQVQNGLM
ncbi:MAG: DUF4173 domain-containing protein [Firmicutes bacterium]|nr:DUF4173 domain-containing protein [Bacillota bacterium]